MQHICKNSWCGQMFEITDEDLAFYDRVSPVITGKKYAIPPPTLCPDCRQQRRLLHCNEQFLYPGTCALCKKRILTQFPPESESIYYCRDCWHSDRWDSRSYERTIDFTRPFLEQIAKLKRTSPSLALDVQGELINSDYIHYAGSCKNCYLIMHADFCEDCYYGYGFKRNRSCVDGYYNLHCELCYDCIDCHKCYELKGSQDCIQCHTSAFLRDCIGCDNCFLCVGLREKAYCFENVQLTREDYEQKMCSMSGGSFERYQSCMKRRRELEQSHSFKEFQGSNLEDCLGNYLVNCKHVRFCFDCEDVEEAKYCSQIVLGAKNIYDVYQYGTNLQESLECLISGENSYHLLFCMGGNVRCSDLMYCCYMETSKNCFACANMRQAEYCILNRQYSKEEYEALVPKMIEYMIETGEWGEFFSSNLSLFGYNKTTAQMWYPLAKEQALERGMHWDDAVEPPPSVSRTVQASQLPDSIDEIPDAILEWAVVCEASGKPFRIIAKELSFYREHKIPLPRRCPYQRHLDRFAQRNPRKLWERNCGKCGKEIRTTYAPDRPEIVYCESCYLKEVY